MEIKNYKTQWDLSNYYESIDDKQINSDIEKIKSEASSFAKKYKNKLATMSEKDFLIFFEDKNNLSKLIHKVGLYFFKLSSLDTQDQDIIKKEGEFNHIMVEVSNELLFISQELKEIGFEKLIELSKKESLKDYNNYFYQQANSIKYILDEKTEFALNLKENSGEDAFNNLYEELTNSFVFEIEMDGEIKKLTDSEIRTLRLNNDEKIRIKAYESIRNVYNDKKIQITLGNTYNAIVKDWVSDVKLRKFSTVMEPRNISEELDNEVIDMLLEEVENSYHLFQRYVKAKAKLMNKKKLKSSDLFAPVSSKEKKYEFEESLNIFLNTRQYKTLLSSLFPLAFLWQ
jgi:oligoendopeptidase F